MSTIATLAAQAETKWPLLVWTITSKYNGTVLRISQAPVTFGGNSYSTRVLAVSGLETRLEEADLGVAAIPSVTLRLANVDGQMSSWDNTNFFKHASITGTFIFYDIATQTAASSDSVVIFRGVCDPPERVTPMEMVLTAYNRFNAHMVLLPDVRIQQRSPTFFPGEGKKDADTADPTDTQTAAYEWKNSQTDRNLPAWSCLPFGQQVLTADGLKSIENINLRDRIVSAKGIERAVLATMARPYDGEIYRFRVSGWPEPLEFTAEHPILAIDPQSGAQEWRLACELHEGNWLAFPRFRQKRDLAQFESLALFREQAQHPDFWWMFGNFLGDGNTEASRIFFSVGKGEKADRNGERLRILAKELFDEDLKVRGENGNRRLGITGTMLSRFFREYCYDGRMRAMRYKGELHKTIPGFTQFLPDIAQQEIVKGYIDADGCMVNDNGWRAVAVNGVSLPLLSGVQRMLLCSGVTARISVAHEERTGCFQGRTVREHKAYQMWFNLPTWMGGPPQRWFKAFKFPNADYCAVRIRSIEKRLAHHELVANLNVADDNSFCTPIFATHNCGYGPMRGGFGFPGTSPLGNFKLAETLNADIFSSTTIGKTTLSMSTNEMKDHIVLITGGTGAEQSRRIASNTATTITVANAWTTTPDATSDFAVAYSFCDRSAQSCKNRGMYSTDSLSRTTRRFRGFTFVPGTTNYRTLTGERKVSTVDTQAAKYNQVVPRVYGTARVNCRVLFSRADTAVRGHLLACEGEIKSLSSLIVEGKMIPKTQQVAAQADVSGTWTDKLGARGGNTEDANFVGHDPYNLYGIVYLDKLPTQFVGGATNFNSSVVVEGRLVETFDKDGASLGWSFSENPAWILLDVLKSSGWVTADVNLKSFHSYSVYADQTIATYISSTQTISKKRFQISLVLFDQRPAAEIVRAIAGAGRITTSYDTSGKLRIDCENALANTTLSAAITVTGQQFVTVGDGAGIAVDKKLIIDEGGGNEETVTVISVQLSGNDFQVEANFTSTHSSGETVKGQTEFDFTTTSIAADDRSGVPKIARRSIGSRETPNEYVVEFQNRWRDFSQDSLQLMDTREANDFGARATAQLPAEGFQLVDPALRAARLALYKSQGRRDSANVVKSRGNLFVEVESSVKGVLIPIGGIVRVTWSEEGWTNKQFWVIGINPAQDELFPYWRIAYLLREHDDAWYTNINGTLSVGQDLPLPPNPAPPSTGGSSFSSADFSGAQTGGDRTGRWDN